MRWFSGGDDEYTEFHVPISYEAIQDWSSKIAEDVSYDERFDMMYYDQTGSGIDTVLSDDILPYLRKQADTVTTLDIDDVDVTTMLGINLGAAVGRAISPYARGDPGVYDALGRNALDQIRDVEYTASWGAKQAPREDFQGMVRTGVDHYHDIRDAEDRPQHTIYIDQNTAIIAHYLDDWDSDQQ